jgi:hypothetical protein
LPFGVYNPVVMIGRSYGKHIEGGVWPNPVPVVEEFVLK